MHIEVCKQTLCVCVCVCVCVYALCLVLLTHLQILLQDYVISSVHKHIHLKIKKQRSIYTHIRVSYINVHVLVEKNTIETHCFSFYNLSPLSLLLSPESLQLIKLLLLTRKTSTCYYCCHHRTVGILEAELGVEGGNPRA